MVGDGMPKDLFRRHDAIPVTEILDPEAGSRFSTVVIKRSFRANRHHLDIGHVDAEAKETSVAEQPADAAPRFGEDTT